MAFITSEVIEFVLRGEIAGQAAYNAWQYNIVANVPEATTTEVCEAWWGTVRAWYRGLFHTTSTFRFNSVLVRSLTNPDGEYGEYAIPLEERTGTRTGSNQGDNMPPFCAASIRLTVSERVTKPGQKRFACLMEGDQSNGDLIGGVVNALATLGSNMSKPLLLSFTEADLTLQPLIVRKGFRNVPTAQQEVTGYLVNTRVTSQTSRKFGHGI